MSATVGGRIRPGARQCLDWLPGLLAQAGFARVERYGRLRTGFGSLELIEAQA